MKLAAFQAIPESGKQSRTLSDRYMGKSMQMSLQQRHGSGLRAATGQQHVDHIPSV